jgi:hypothetical protein
MEGSTMAAGRGRKRQSKEPVWLSRPILPAYDPRRYQPTVETLLPPVAAVWDLLRYVAEEAQRSGWKVRCDPAYARWTVSPMSTPGDEGFPPLLLFKPPRIMAVIVSERDKVVSPEMQSWLDVLSQYGSIEIRHWNVHDWLNGVVHDELSREPASEEVVAETEQAGRRRTTGGKKKTKRRRKKKGVQGGKESAVVKRETNHSKPRSLVEQDNG